MLKFSIVAFNSSTLAALGWFAPLEMGLISTCSFRSGSSSIKKQKKKGSRFTAHHQSTAHSFKLTGIGIRAGIESTRLFVCTPRFVFWSDCITFVIHPDSIRWGCDGWGKRGSEGGCSSLNSRCRWYEEIIRPQLLLLWCKEILITTAIPSTSADAYPAASAQCSTARFTFTLDAGCIRISLLFRDLFIVFFLLSVTTAPQKP